MRIGCFECSEDSRDIDEECNCKIGFVEVEKICISNKLENPINYLECGKNCKNCNKNECL